MTDRLVAILAGLAGLLLIGLQALPALSMVGIGWRADTLAFRHPEGMWRQ